MSYSSVNRAYLTQAFLLHHTLPSQVENTRQPLRAVLKGGWEQGKAPNEDNKALDHSLKGPCLQPGSWNKQADVVSPSLRWGQVHLPPRALAVVCTSVDAHESTSRY